VTLRSFVHHDRLRSDSALIAPVRSSVRTAEHRGELIYFDDPRGRLLSRFRRAYLHLPPSPWFKRACVPSTHARTGVRNMYAGSETASDRCTCLATYVPSIARVHVSRGEPRICTHARTQVRTCVCVYVCIIYIYIYIYMCVHAWRMRLIGARKSARVRERSHGNARTPSALRAPAARCTGKPPSRAVCIYICN